jgi:hypothetical protein
MRGGRLGWAESNCGGSGAEVEPGEEVDGPEVDLRRRASSAAVAHGYGLGLEESRRARAVDSIAADGELSGAEQVTMSIIPSSGHRAK